MNAQPKSWFTEQQLRSYTKHSRDCRERNEENVKRWRSAMRALVEVRNLTFAIRR